MLRASQPDSQLLVASPQDSITSLSPLRIRPTAGRTNWKLGQELLGEEEDVNGATKGEKEIGKGTRNGIAQKRISYSSVSSNQLKNKQRSLGSQVYVPTASQHAHLQVRQQLFSLLWTA